jgi:ribonuclease VapC
MSDVAVLDSSALLAVATRETGWQQVEPLLANAAISAANLLEVLQVMSRRGAPPGDAWRLLRAIGLRVVPLDAGQAVQAAHFYRRQDGLSLGDRCAIALASSLRGILVTSDRRQAAVAARYGITTWNWRDPVSEA